MTETGNVVLKFLSFRPRPTPLLFSLTATFLVLLVVTIQSAPWLRLVDSLLLAVALRTGLVVAQGITPHSTSSTAPADLLALYRCHRQCGLRDDLHRVRNLPTQELRALNTILDANVEAMDLNTQISKSGFLTPSSLDYPVLTRRVFKLYARRSCI